MLEFFENFLFELQMIKLISLRKLLELAILQLLLFPEGTDKCERATERSRIYAEKKGLVHYAHVLHPKTTGFTFIIKKMREGQFISSLERYIVLTCWMVLHLFHISPYRSTFI